MGKLSHAVDCFSWSACEIRVRELSLMNWWECAVFWSCQLDDTPSNSTLELWQKAGGVPVNSGNVIAQVIRKALTTPSAVAKVCSASLLILAVS